MFEFQKLREFIGSGWSLSRSPAEEIAGIAIEIDYLLMSNHIAVAYGDIFGEMVALSQELGFRVRIISLSN